VFCIVTDVPVTAVVVTSEEPGPVVPTVNWYVPVVPVPAFHWKVTVRDCGVEPGAGETILAAVILPRCVKVNGWPPIVRLAERVTKLVLAESENFTVPLPVPEVPEVMVSQAGTEPLTVQAQPAVAVTLTVPVVAAALNRTDGAVTE